MIVREKTRTTKSVVRARWLSLYAQGHFQQFVSPVARESAQRSLDAASFSVFTTHLRRINANAGGTARVISAKASTASDG